MIIEEACVVEPMVIPDDLSELGEAMIRSPSGDTAAAAILAGRGRLLLSEDMMMRRLASEVFGVKGVWVQAVLLSAVQANGCGRLCRCAGALGRPSTWLCRPQHICASLDVRAR